ncbi:hypothetical protein P154DRAFT_272657 [Amniculicola lignicola CBS 123094]|uniref:Uncharacterized protein n=1 Tax=Amniculicola lignicola CBS 123094 TaxID=1392246 RepID=A0A6A5WAB7_9PLEO|nr:hypothetical protein P154DRAFT_272657 [Amniculicola lignicola CBS 123094]
MTLCYGANEIFPKFWVCLIFLALVGLQLNAAVVALEGESFNNAQHSQADVPNRRSPTDPFGPKLPKWMFELSWWSRGVSYISMSARVVFKGHEFEEGVGTTTTSGSERVDGTMEDGLVNRRKVVDVSDGVIKFSEKMSKKISSGTRTLCDLAVCIASLVVLQMLAGWQERNVVVEFQCRPFSINAFTHVSIVAAASNAFSISLSTSWSPASLNFSTPVSVAATISFMYSARFVTLSSRTPMFSLIVLNSLERYNA